MHSSGPSLPSTHFALNKHNRQQAQLPRSTEQRLTMLRHRGSNTLNIKEPTNRETMTNVKPKPERFHETFPNHKQLFHSIVKQEQPLSIFYRQGNFYSFIGKHSQIIILIQSSVEDAAFSRTLAHAKWPVVSAVLWLIQAQNATFTSAVDCWASSWMRYHRQIVPCIVGKSCGNWALCRFLLQCCNPIIIFSAANIQGLNYML